jgi:hypothetical protein
MPAATAVLRPRLRPEPEQPSSDGPTGIDLETQKAIRELLELLPSDAVLELNKGDLDPNDPGFLEGLTDHVSRQALADPQKGRRLLTRLIRLKKLIARDLRASHPEVSVSSTLTRSSQQVGRNVPCPCGSGKKFKHCCLRRR